MDLKLNHESSFQIAGPNNFEQVDPKLLINRKLTCSVIIHASHMTYNSGLPMLQIYMRSCIILNIVREIPAIHLEDEDVKEYLRENSVKSSDSWNELMRLGTKFQSSKLQEIIVSPSKPAISTS
ncbi:Hypothetical protein HVR_LOCUS499 [uncultured virus]|nr:Hypothetical protein HVR_LOCUS499 [uncultured virus]